MHLGRVDLSALARAEGTPLYVYDGARVRANVARLQQALAAAVRHPRLFYAMKSNRHPPLLTLLRSLEIGGLDVCSPGEVEWARSCGFADTDLSYTGTALSADDLSHLARRPGLTLNLDSRAALRRWAAVAPGSRIGLRVNPALGIGYRQNPRLRYAGGGVTKFGILVEDLPAALAEARELGLIVDGLHVHAGCGFLTPQLPLLDRILARVAEVAKTVPGLRYVNLGGGLGIPLVKSDRPLDLAAWSQVVRRHFGRVKYEVWIEPGDYLVKDAGVLLLEVNDVESRGGEWFVGLNGGFNLHPEPVFYDLPLEPVPVQATQGRGQGQRQRFTFAGNINEAHDVWARKVGGPLPQAGAVYALLNAGGYGAAMASDHCRRGGVREILLW